MISLLLFIKLFFTQVLPGMTTQQLNLLASMYGSTVCYAAHAHLNYIEQQYISKKLDIEKKIKAIVDDKRYEEQVLFLQQSLSELTKSYNRKSAIAFAAYMTAIAAVVVPAWGIIIHRGYRWFFPTAHEKERLRKEHEAATIIYEKYQAEEDLSACLLAHKYGQLDTDQMPVSCEKSIKAFIARAGNDEYQEKRSIFQQIRNYA